MFFNDQLFGQIEEETVKAIKEVFGNRIKQSFIIQMRSKVKKIMGNELFQCFRNMYKFDGETILKGNQDLYVDYELCRNIVGIHRTNTIFMDENQRAKLQSDSNYRKKLAEEVCAHMRLRPFVGYYTRLNQFFLGDEFLFFSIPYKIFAICIHSNMLLARYGNVFLYDLFLMIFNKGLSALCLLENNMFDCIYPITRAIIEIYIKILAFKTCPKAYNKYKELCHYDLVKGCNIEYPEEFNQIFLQRRKQNENSKLDYLHFGWVDAIPDFDKKTKRKNYKINSVFDYLNDYYSKINPDFLKILDYIKYLYNFCHTFTHGTSGRSKYPLVHYFDIAKMLSLTIIPSYQMLCEEINVDTKINNVDIISMLEKNVALMLNQDKLKSIENFEEYYKTFKINN